MQIEKPVIATIARTREKQNILLTTTEEYNAEFLVKYKKIWSNCFSFKREQKLEPWAQVVAHGVPISPFLGEGGSKLLKEEIETLILLGYRDYLDGSHLEKRDMIHKLGLAL